MQSGRQCQPAGFLSASQRSLQFPSASSGWLGPVPTLRGGVGGGGQSLEDMMGCGHSGNPDRQARKLQAHWWGRSQKCGSANT